MKITFLKRDSQFGEEVDFVSLLKDDQIHYVSVAVPGLTMPSCAVEFAGGFSVDQRREFMLKVNDAKETGTLYPKINITLLPSPFANYLLEVIQHNNGDYSEEQITNHILDAFKANLLYIKSDTMYFDFRCICSEKLYISALQKAINQQNQQDLPQNIITWNTPVDE